jgi:broad specificity phosphatase PhoE
VKTIYLVRHGQASWHGDDYDVLTPLGREQSRLVGAALVKRGLVPDLIVSGELQRHRDTADLAAEAAGWEAPRVTDARWAEFDHVDLIKQHDPRFTTHADLKVYGADTPEGRRELSVLLRASLQSWLGNAGHYVETFHEFTERVVAACDDTLARLDDDQSAVVFTSGGPIGALALTVLDGPPEQWLKLIVSVNTGISQFILLPDESLVLATLNDHAHVDGVDVLTF